METKLRNEINMLTAEIAAVRSTADTVRKNTHESHIKEEYQIEIDRLKVSLAVAQIKLRRIVAIGR